ncbi:Putative membrane spanning protein, partial [Streptococcus thermophilus CNCM I-1630]
FLAIYKLLPLSVGHYCYDAHFWGSSLMVYFKRDNENRSFFQLLQSVISIVFGIILLSASVWVLSGVAVTIIAWWLLVSAFTQGFQAYHQRQFGFSVTTCFVNRLDLFSIWSLALLCTIFLSLSYWSLCSLLNYLCGCICPLLYLPPKGKPRVFHSDSILQRPWILQGF